jgi:PAS domain S-box-containing protein
MNHLLLIEGSRDSALHISKLITRNLDVDLQHVGSGAEALELITKQPIDLVIVDVQLPQIDGFQICGQLHESEDTQHVPVLLLTSLEGESYPEVRALSMGPGEIYTLPTPGSNLVAWINILLKIIAPIGAAKKASTRSEAQDFEVYKTLLDNVEDPIIWADATTGEILLANSSALKITGFPADMLPGRRFRDLVIEDQAASLDNFWEEALKNGGGFISDVELIRRSGVHVKVDAAFHAQILSSHDGFIIKLKEPIPDEIQTDSSASSYGITNLPDFLSALGHEVRNPLTAISTDVQYMQMTYADTDTQGEIYSEILEAVHRMDSVMRQVVDYIRPTELKLLKTDLKQALDEVIERNTESLLNVKGVELSVDLDDEVPGIDVDPDRFMRALTGLLQHCANEAGEKGQVAIKMKRSEDAIAISFSHNGQGLSAQRHQVLFDPVSCLKSADPGLGLAYVKKIIDKHHFTIEVESQLRSGVDFKVLIPLTAHS